MTSTYTPSQELIKSTEKIDIIQALRGIAVIMVVIFHFKEIIRPGELLRKELDFLFDSGAAGVDLFFVISGFIMVFVTKKSTGGIKYAGNFLIKRIVRIWPLYIFSTIVYALIAAPVIEDISLDIVTKMLKSIFFIPLSYLNPPFFGYAYLAVGWSLNFEMYFYLMIAVSLLSGKYRWWTFAALVISTLVIIPLAYGNLTLHPLQTQNYGSLAINLITNPIIWEFIYGVIIGLLYITPSSARIFNSIFQSGTVAAFIMAIAIWQYFSGFYGGHGPLYWGFSMAMVFMSLVFYNRGKSIKYPSWLIYLGDISFSVYLWHIPVAMFIAHSFEKISMPHFTKGTPAFFLTLSLTIIISHLSYQFLEKRLHAFLITKLRFK